MAKIDKIELNNVSYDISDPTTVNQGSVVPSFEGKTPLLSFTWNVSDTTYRPIYQMDNTGWTYSNMRVEVAYRVTVTGTGINQVFDVADTWYRPESWPLTTILARTESTTNTNTGMRYLRAVYPVAAYINDDNYKLGQEIAPYNATARTVTVEVFKTDPKVTWNETMPTGSIYVGSTYQGNNSVTVYSTRGWILRSPVTFTAPTAAQANRVDSYESTMIASSTLKTGAAVSGGYLAFLADDNKVYPITNTTVNMVTGGCARIGLVSSAAAANAALDARYWRSVYNLSSTQVGYISHDALALGERVYLRCRMDASGYIHSDNYLATGRAPGYTWMDFGVATASNTIYMDVRRPIFYTLDANGKLTHIDGIEIA